MEGTGKSQQTIFSKRMDRRTLLKYAAVAGAAAIAVPTLQACGGIGGASEYKPGTKLAAPPQGTGGGKPLIFRGWNYHVEVVQDNLETFKKQYDEQVDYQTITGDYGSIVAQMHVNKEPLNFCYANPQTAARWYLSGWAHDYSGWWDVEKASAELYPGWRAIATIKGKLVGLPYFQSIRGNIVTNDALLEKVGITPQEYPKTWDELYAQLYDIKKANVTDVPFLPHWFATWFGVTWGFLFEAQNRGFTVFDEKGNPVFDPQCYEMVEYWKKLLADGIVPKETLTMQEADFIDAFATGRYAYSPQQTYDSKVFNDPAKSKFPGKSRIVPATSQPWGLIDSGLYVIIKRAGQTDSDVARSMRLGAFYGWRDKEGNLRVSKRWAVEQALNSGYPATLEDPDVIAAYKSWMPDYDFMMPAMQSVLQAAKSPAVWQRLFYDEWNSAAATVLPEAILGQKTVKAALDELKETANKLIDKYKKQDPGD